MNSVLCGTLFQKTRAPGAKFFPFTIMTKGTLFTGTVLGSSVVSAGGVKPVPNVTLGSCIGDPQPKVKTRTSRRLAERIGASSEMAKILLPPCSGRHVLRRPFVWARHLSLQQ